MQPDEKWIFGITPDTRVGKAARYSLRLRLDAIWKLLPLAAERSHEDIEYIHQLRVLTRRSIAVLDLYDPVLRRKASRRMRKTLKQIRRAAGDARDMDVLALNMKDDAEPDHEVLSARVARLRRRAQRPVRQIHRHLSRGKRWERHVGRLLRKPRGRRRERGRERFRPWACRRMKKIVRDFFRSSPETIHDIEGLHRFRIEGKRLRYAIEILAAAFPAALRVEVYPRIEALQEKLGEIHDRHVAIRRFQNWAAETDNRSEKNQLLRLADADATRLSSLVEEFRAWWSPKYQADLQRKFRKIVRRAEQRC